MKTKRLQPKGNRKSIRGAVIQLIGGFRLKV